MRYVLDTNILMSTENYEKLFKDYEGHELVIGANVIEELDNIKTREVIESFELEVDYELDECGWYAKDLVTLEGEDLEAFNKLYGMLDDIEDVTDVYHNVEM